MSRVHFPHIGQPIQETTSDSKDGTKEDAEISLEKPEKLYKFVAGPSKKYNQTFHATEEDSEYVLTKKAEHVCE